MEDKKNVLKRLKTLELQAREATDEDLLKEAEELEREMAENHIELALPPDYLKQILAKGKLLEAEMALHDVTMHTESTVNSAHINIPTTNNKKKKFWNFFKNHKK